MYTHFINCFYNLLIEFFIPEQLNGPL